MQENTSKFIHENMKSWKREFVQGIRKCFTVNELFLKCCLVRSLHNK